MSVLNAEAQVFKFNLLFLGMGTHFMYGFLIMDFISFLAGEVISDRDKCPQCKGNKITQEKKVVEVHVEKGMQNGQKITFEGQADEAVSELLMC